MMYDPTLVPTFKQFYAQNYPVTPISAESLFEAINLYLALYMPLPKPTEFKSE